MNIVEKLFLTWCILGYAGFVLDALLIEFSDKVVYAFRIRPYIMIATAILLGAIYGPFTIVFSLRTWAQRARR
jgi:hypothetical protein